MSIVSLESKYEKNISMSIAQFLLYDVMIYLLKTASGAGHQTKYVLFDSWFSNPKQILDVKELGLNVIAMVKRSSKRNYIFEGKQMNIKKIFASCKKQRGRSKYLLSVPVKVGQDKNGDNGIDARIVAIAISTRTGLPLSALIWA